MHNNVMLITMKIIEIYGFSTRNVRRLGWKKSVMDLSESKQSYPENLEFDPDSNHHCEFRSFSAC